MSGIITKLALGIFLGAMVLLVISANTGAIPDFLSFHHRIPFGDKLGHFLLMGTLAFFATLVSGLRTLSIWGVRLPLGAVIVFIVVLLEEISQIFVPARTFSLLDLAADIAGISFFGWVAFRFVCPRLNRKPEREIS